MRKYVLYSAKLEREDKFLAIGARGRSPAQAATQWQPISPIGLTACKAGISQRAALGSRANQPSRAGVQHKRRQPFNNRLTLIATQTATVINRINPTPCFSAVAAPRRAPMACPTAMLSPTSQTICPDRINTVSDTILVV